jgi:uncharacterized protein YigA (DUF484 family)
MSAPFPEDVADYLKNNPGFFEQYADLMAQIFVPHPHGGRAVSLAERQMLTLRDKNRETESKLAELIAFGEENDQISEKVHRLAVGLIAVETFSAVIHLLRFHLRDDFSVPHVALRLWKKPEGGSTSGFGTGAWFGEPAAHLRSQALVALCDGGATIGMLALGSEDGKRFYPEMGTLYLERIGEMVSAALIRVAKFAK